MFDEVGVAEDMLDFMRELYAVHPELKDRCAGEGERETGIPLCPCNPAEQLMALLPVTLLPSPTVPCKGLLFLTIQDYVGNCVCIPFAQGISKPLSLVVTSYQPISCL